MFENFGDMVKMAKEMQARMQEMQQNLGNIRVYGDAGGGMVRVEMNGHHEITKVEILDVALEDREILEGLVHAATNDAVRRIKEEIQENMGKLGLGFANIPGLPNIF